MIQSTPVRSVRTKYCFVPERNYTTDRDCYIYRISLKLKYRNFFLKELDFHDFHSIFLGLIKRKKY